jgi:2-oxo-3-hexenedioate decarboxylase
MAHRDESTDLIARQLLSALDEVRQISSIGARDAAFDLDAAYAVTPIIRRLREERGEQVAGRKIGFTNTTIWAEYGVHAPIWGYVYDTTRSAISPNSVSLARLVEPRLEPEIMLHLAHEPEPGMNDLDLMGCVGAVSHGFEIVQSLFADWRFTPADTVAAFGLHGLLLTGVPKRVEPGEAGRWIEALGGFTIELARDGEPVGRGAATNVLGGGPLAALRHVVDLLAADPYNPQLAAGEIVSTGTVTRAFPVAPSETWSTRIEGLDLPGVTVRFG